MKNNQKTASGIVKDFRGIWDTKIDKVTERLSGVKTQNSPLVLMRRGVSIP